MKSFWKDNGLTVALVALFLFSLAGMVWSGLASYNEGLASHGRQAVALLTYLASGAFLSALFENWESEFLQMAFYVVLTAMLYQRGSAESRDPDSPGRAGDSIPSSERRRHPVRVWLYSYSLGLALAGLFFASFALHVWASFRASNEEALWRGAQPPEAMSYLLNAQVWFESFQNWQSEFMSTAALVLLSIFLLHKGSPESKPVLAPDSKTGT